jgi:hypothetical protein
MSANGNGQFREDEVVVRKSKINGEWVENRYVKVGGKLRVLHQENEHVSIMTEILMLEPDYAVSKATVTTTKGTFTGIGVATLKMDSRIGDAIVSLSETRAVARACRHAGYAMDSCGAEELAFAEMEPQREQTTSKQPASVFPEGNGESKPEAKPLGNGNGRATQAQCRALYVLTKRAQYTDQDVESLLRPLNAATFNDLSRESASQLISYLQTEAAA